MWYSRSSSVAVLIGALLLNGCSSSFDVITPEAQNVKPERPNIVLILADDLGWSDIGAYGSEIDTPNLDWLAEQGLRFTQFHNAAKCFPSRSSILTGQYAHSVGMGDTWRYPMINDATLADVLGNAGYRTLMAGKYHGVDNPFDLGFEHYWGLRAGAANYFNPGYQRAGEPVPAQKQPQGRTWCFDSKCLTPFTPESTDFYVTDAFTDWAIELLERYQGDTQPFFLYLAYTAPHDPLHAPPEDIAKYRQRYRDGYHAIAAERQQRLQQLGLMDERYPRSAPEYRDWQDLSATERDDQALKMAVYAAMIDRLDQNIGRLLTHLRTTNQLDNTLLIFLSDNGASAEVVDIGQGQVGQMDRWSSLGPDWANVSNLPFRKFKNYSYQGGISTPMIWHWPNGLKQPGATTETLGHIIDLQPTLIEVTGATLPTQVRDETPLPLPGISLAPLLNGQTVTRSEPLFWHWDLGRAVRLGDWKLVAWDGEDSPTPGRYELYDMRVDKTETNNLAARYPQKVQELEALYQTWFAEVRAHGHRPGIIPKVATGRR